MQTVISAFTTEERAPTRGIAQNVQVSWKKDYLSSIRFFTIGVSTIGGNDTIPGGSGVQSAWNQYQYVDESIYVTGMSYQRELNTPMGGLVKSLANVSLDNTTKRFTPQYAGGRADIFTAVLPRRPMIINAGFNIDGTDVDIPQFVGVTNKQVEIDLRNATAKLSGVDFMDYIQNIYVDHTEMFTSQYTDVVVGNLLAEAGFSTAQYDLDSGLNRVGFGLFDTSSKLGDVINKLAQAENGHFFQDEEGRLKFWNRQHFDSSSYTQTQRIITTAQVINAAVPDTSNIINVVEITASPRDVVDTELLISIGAGSGLGVQELAAGDTEVWLNYNDPVFEVDVPVRNGTVGQTSYFVANDAEDGTGSDVTSSVTLSRIDNFATTSKLTFTNSTGGPVFITTLDVWGRAARKTGDIYYREKIGSSVTAFEEQILQINNDYIQDPVWAQSYAALILRSFSDPEKILHLTIRAIPELQMGDLISWQGRTHRVYGITTTLDAGVGFIQELKVIKDNVTTYFRIGISTIGGTDVIAA